MPADWRIMVKQPARIGTPLQTLRMNLGLAVVDGIGRLDVKGNGHACEWHDEVRDAST